MRRLLLTSLVPVLVFVACTHDTQKQHSRAAASPSPTESSSLPSPARSRSPLPSPRAAQLYPRCGISLRLGSRPSGTQARSAVYELAQADPRHYRPSSDDISLYDVSTAKERRLTKDGENLTERSPRYVDANHVAFMTGKTDVSNPNRPFTTSVIALIDLRTRSVCQAFATLDDLRAFSWSPDGRTIAFMYGDDPERLALYSIRERSYKNISSLGDVVGRETGEIDSISLEWSPDGSRLLAVDTGIGEFESDHASRVFVVDDHGRDMARPRSGTFAIWLDSDSVLYSTFSNSAPRRWFVVDLRTGRARQAGLSPLGLRPRLSPDGALVAYFVGGSTPIVSTYAPATGRNRRIGTGVEPIWFDLRRVIITKTEKCSAGMCDYSSWESIPKTSQIDLTSGSETSFSLRTTQGADVLYA